MCDSVYSPAGRLISGLHPRGRAPISASPRRFGRNFHCPTFFERFTLTADAQTPTSEAASTQSFEADVSRLLHLMVHSVYSDREIFVRELVSNAADACEKLRYEVDRQA